MGDVYLSLSMSLDGYVAGPGDDVQARHRWLGRSWATGRPWGTGRAYPNFPDPDLEDWARAYHGTNLERLARVKERYDSDNLFRFHQSVPSYGVSTA
jgi:FAD/FMN-containing dehydrogenase